MTRRLVQSTNVVEFDGYVYGTLDNKEPSAPCDMNLQETFIEMPLGWELAPDDPDIVKNVVATHPWGCIALLVQGSKGAKAYFTLAVAREPSYPKKRDGTDYQPGDLEGSYGDVLQKQGSAYKIGWMQGIARATCARMLIRSPFGSKRRRIQTSSTLIAGMWKDKTLADLTIVCDGVQIKCHRAVLAQGSEVFAKMLSGEMKESKMHTVEIKDAVPAVFEDLLQFFYVGEPPQEMSIDDRAALLVLADRFQVDSLFEDTAHRLLSGLGCDTVGPIVRAFRPFAHRPETQVLWARLCDDIRRNPELQSAALMNV